MLISCGFKPLFYLKIPSKCQTREQWEGPKIEVRQGDVIWIPPNVKHWHGATTTTGMSHYAFVEKQHEGENSYVVENIEPVTDIQYNER